MFQLNSSSLCGSASWDTNYARTYLHISEDQLEKLNKIPGWSKKEISENITSENDTALENIEKQVIQEVSSSNKSLQITQTNNSTKDILKTKIPDSDSQLNLKTIEETDKLEFLKNISLSQIKKKHTSSYSLQRSSSLPDLREEFQSLRKELTGKRSVVKRVHSVEKDISNFKLPSLLTKNLLDETDAAPVDSDDSVKRDRYLFKNSRKSFSCPLEYPDGQLKQKKLKTFDDSILHHKYLKSIEKSNSVPSSPESAKITFQPEMSVLGKKLLLLEKRFSPSKEMSDQQFKSQNDGKLNCLKSLTSQILASTDEVVTTISSSNSVEILVGTENSSLSKSHKILKSQSNSQSLSEKCDAPGNTFDSLEGNSGNVPQTTICNFESFISPPVPCGQILATEVPSQKSDEFNTPRKLQVSNLPVDIEQPLSTEVLSVSQQIPEQKLTKLNASNELQKAESSGETAVLEKPSGTFSVFSANLSEKVPDLPSSKESGTKRKRRSRSEKASKKLDVKKLKRTDFQFSSAQIKSMIEIMKIFHTEF